MSRVINIKGDKSITHRVIMLSSIISNDIIIKNPSNCIDVLSTIDVLNLCGANIIINNKEITNNSKIHKNPNSVLDCGNSGTTARLLIGLLFGMGISATIDGDSSLRSRPMDRVLDPLESMNLQYKSLNKKNLTYYNKIYSLESSTNIKINLKLKIIKKKILEPKT